jgi:MFS family permease
MGYFIAMYSVASYATDGLGLSQTEAAAVQSFLSAGLMIGRPLTGIALDQGGRVNIALLANVIAGITCWALWLPARSFAVLAVFAFLHGCAAGSVWSAALPVTAQVVGPTHLGPALAMFWLVAAAPAAVSSALATVLLDYSKDVLGRHGAEAYCIPIIFGGGLYFVSGLSLYGAKVHCQKSFAIWRKV